MAVVENSAVNTVRLQSLFAPGTGAIGDHGCNLRQLQSFLEASVGPVAAAVFSFLGGPLLACLLAAVAAYKKVKQRENGQCKPE